MIVKTTTKNEYTTKTFFSDFRNVFNILILQAAAVITIYVLYSGIKYNMSDSLMLHICLCTVGYVFCMTSAVILFAGDNIFGRSLTRFHKSWVHGALIGTGSILAITGISIEINGRGSEWPHFESIHAITGLISMILMITACVGGLIVLNIRKVTKLVPFFKPIWWKILHNSVGLLGYIIGMTSFCYGFDSWWFDLIGTYELKLTIIIASSIITIFCSITPLLVIFDYLKTAVGR